MVSARDDEVAPAEPARSRTLQRMTSWLCDCWTVMVGTAPDDLEQARAAAAVRVHADRRVRRAATDPATPPEVRFVFDLDADSEDHARTRAAVVVGDAVAGGHLDRAHWTYRVRVVG